MECFKKASLALEAKSLFRTGFNTSAAFYAIRFLQDLVNRDYEDRTPGPHAPED
jgi:hypothetical protein